MTCSPAKLAANRANARKSTGPRTEEGKARSRRNALKHGLTGEGVALPTEDVAAVEARFETLQAELNPSGLMGAILVRRIAMLSVRLDRCSRHEAAALSARVRAAGGDFDEARMAEVQALVALLDDDPAGAVRRLRRMPEGVDRMLAAWAMLREDLARGPVVAWTSTHSQLAEKLMGLHPEGIGNPRVVALFRGVWGDFRHLDDHEGGDLDDPGRRDWARARLTELVDAEIAGLRALRATFDPTPIALDRAGATALALFDPGQEATLARKYEAAAERGIYRALHELRVVERAAGPAEPEDADAPEAEAVGSISVADREPAAPADGPTPGRSPARGPRPSGGGKAATPPLERPSRPGTA